MTNNSENDQQDSVDEELGQVGESLNGITDRFTRDDTQTDEQEKKTRMSETIETTETTSTDETTETSPTTEGNKTPEPGDETFQLREHWNGRTIYLPDKLVDDLDLRYQELNLEWQREYGEELPKNEQFYPAVVRAALDQTSVEAKLGLQDNE